MSIIDENNKNVPPTDLEAVQIRCEKDQYTRLGSFDEFCLYCELYTRNKVLFFPEVFPSRSHNLVESDGRIREFIPLFNRYGYFTDVSQPARSDKLYTQRAAVVGYMRREVAYKIRNRFKADKRIKVIMKEDNHPKYYVTKSKKDNKGVTCFSNFNLPYETFFIDRKLDIIEIVLVDREFANEDEYLFEQLLAALTEFSQPVDVDKYPHLKDFF